MSFWQSSSDLERICTVCPCLGPGDMLKWCFCPWSTVLSTTKEQVILVVIHEYLSCSSTVTFALWPGVFVVTQSVGGPELEVVQTPDGSSDSFFLCLSLSPLSGLFSLSLGLSCLIRRAVLTVDSSLLFQVRKQFLVYFNDNLPGVVFLGCFCFLRSILHSSRKRLGYSYYGHYCGLWGAFTLESCKLWNLLQEVTMVTNKHIVCVNVLERITPTHFLWRNRELPIIRTTFSLRKSLSFKMDFPSVLLLWALGLKNFCECWGLIHLPSFQRVYFIICLHV